MKGSFEFILGMYSIIIGLGVSKLLEGVKNSIVSRRPLRGSGLYIGMLAIGLAFHATTWLSLWSLRNVETWKVWSFLLVMLVPVLMYLFSSITVPDNDRDMDMGEYYLANARKMHGFLISVIVVNAVTESVILGHVSSILITAIRLAIVCLLLVCAVLPRAIRLHQVILPTVLLGGGLLIQLVNFPIR